MKIQRVVVIFFVMMVNAAEQQSRDSVRDAVFNVVKKILMKAKSDCTYELCPDAQVRPYFASKQGYGIVMTDGLPSHIVTPKGFAPLVDLQQGIFHDIAITEEFCKQLGLKINSEIPVPELKQESKRSFDSQILYEITHCENANIAPLHMK